MKKIVSLFCAAMALGVSLFGCSAQNTSTSSAGTNSESTNQIHVVTTIFAPYDFTRQVIGDQDVDLTMLIKPGTEVHTFEPTAQDILAVQNCDLFVYVGGENDAWVDNLLSSLGSKVKTLKLTDCVSLYPEEQKDGMQAESNESNSTSQDETEWDEHVWTSPKNAIAITGKIAEALCTVDPDHADAYKANAQAYTAKLTTLDQQFQEVVDHAARKTVVFADRFPARYFVEEFGLNYYAAFPGCSADTEASAATVAFLIDKVKSEHIPAVFYIELSNQKLADTICEATGAKKLLFHCCHNVSKDDFDAGATYLSLMTKNVESLREALS